MRLHTSLIRKLWYFLINRLVILFLKKCINKKIDINSVKNILIIRIDRIGDMLLTTPLIHSLKKNIPNSRITIVASAYNYLVVKNNPDVKRVIVINKFNLFKIIKIVGKESFDLAIDPYYGFNLKSALICRFSDSRYKVGYYSREGRYFFNCMINIKDEMYEADRHCSLLEAVGFNIKKCDLMIYDTESDKKKAKIFFRKIKSDGEFIIGINPGTRRIPHRWDKSNFAKLADRLIEELKTTVVFTWGPKEEKLILDIMKLMNNKAVICYKTNVNELAAVVSMFDLFICGDTGPFHIALSKKVPIVALFGKSDYKRWVPSDRKSVHLIKDVSIKDISVEEVFEVCNNILSK